ncbi:MAG TPA: lipopolysaccharide assembly protein LapA domain-containing protein [Acetobacteraceae bacterium]|nr:lipopolysaccharide assembly protein LapA domain-containing protein [Acetobacteraceae bacterium]
MRLVIAAPFLLFLVLFVLSNRQPVAIGLWPTDLFWQVPLSIAVLIAAAVAFLCGALLVWISELGQRRRARRAEATVRLLEEQVQALQARLSPSPLPPPVT